MARRKKKKEAIMGRALICAGLVMKIIQLIGNAISVSALTGTIPTVLTVGVLVGGLAVFAIERMNVVGALSLLSLVGVVGTLFPSERPMHGFIFLSVFVLSFAAMLILAKRKRRTIGAAAVLLLYMLLAVHMTGVLSLPFVLITIALLLLYGAMAASLFL